MKAHLMLHDDWEIFGDGSGNMQLVMFDPLKKVLDICDKYKAKYTIMAEFGQQLAMKASSLKAHQNNSKIWETLLIDAIKRGHDVQLHFHPQWIGAQWKKGKWQLNHGRWSIAHLDKQESIDWLKKGIDYLEELLKPFDSNYKAVAFRAGSWMIQPSKVIHEVFEQLGILADVTIIKGMKTSKNNLGSVDFTNAYSSLVPWYADENDLTVKAKGEKQGLICIPTYSESIYIPKSLFEAINNPLSIPFSIKRSLHQRKKIYKPLYLKGEEKSVENITYFQHHQVFRKIFKSQVVVCNFDSVHYSTLLKMVDRAIENGRKNHYKKIPFIMMAHSKNFYSFSNFDKLLNKLSQKPEILFDTTRSVVSSLQDKSINSWLKGM
jgi:hypothetical protein